MPRCGSSEVPAASPTAWRLALPAPWTASWGKKTVDSVSYGYQADGMILLR